MKLATAPTFEPVTLAEAKLAARISDTSAFDSLVPGLITSARQLAEQLTGRCLVQQTWQLDLPAWPAADEALPVLDATAVAITYLDAAGAWQALPGTAFEFAAAGTRGTIVAPAPGTAWPTLPDRTLAARVRISITAGAADAAAVPQCAKTYIQAVVAYMVDNPAAAEAGAVQDVPLYRSLLDPLKAY